MSQIHCFEMNDFPEKMCNPIEAYIQMCILICILSSIVQINKLSGQIKIP